MKKYLFAGAAIVALAAALTYTSWGARTEATPSDGRPKVIATIFPPYDFARAIGGDRVNLSMLLKPGMESHSYSPSPQDIIDIQNCDLFVCIGGENDRWAEKIIDSLDGEKRPRVLKLIGCVSPVEEEHVEGMQEEEGHDADAGEDHAHEGEYDEHIWTSPRNAAKMAAAVRDGLILVDRKNRPFYEKNAEMYIEELEKLDGDLRSAVGGRHRRLVFGDRFPFRYLADEYGLAYSAAFPGCAAESEANAATVAYLIDKVKTENIPVVFHIEMSNEKTADAICQETGARKRLLHSCHNLSRADFEAGATYISLMRKNLEGLKEALY